jgi:TetR/AcrR family transcriptional regulator, cholesterol catabolism regulator
MSAEQRKQATEDRRQEILTAAARIFHRKGYDATSIQEVAEAVGMLKGSLYYYIDSKEDLLYGVIERAHRLGNEGREQASVEGDSAVSQLRRTIRAHVRNNLEHLADIGVFFHDFRSLGPERRQAIVAERDDYERFIRGLIERGQEEGSLDPDVHPKLATMALLGAMNWVYQWYRDDGPRSPDEIADAFADVALGGVAAPSQR